MVFLSLSKQIGPGAHPASYKMGTGSLPGVKRPGRGVDHPPPSSAEVEERVELYICSPSGPSWPVLGWPLPLPLPANAGTLHRTKQWPRPNARRYTEWRKGSLIHDDTTWLPLLSHTFCATRYNTPSHKPKGKSPLQRATTTNFQTVY